MPARSYRVNTEQVEPSNQETRSNIQAERRIIAALTNRPTSWGMGGGIEVVQCRICETWVSPSRAGVHLVSVHEIHATARTADLIETMTRLGADAREVARQIGARV